MLLSLTLVSVWVSAALVSSSPSSGLIPLEHRSFIERRGCTRVSQCHSKLIPHQKHVCTNHACHKVCVSGYQAKGGKCVKVPTKTSSSSGSKKTPVTAISNLGSVAMQLSKQGITGFLSPQGPGIASWYRTNSGQDSTNGHSWCGYPYNDLVPGFAPSYKTMMSNFGYDWEKAGTAYCGLEAKVTAPDGHIAYLYIADAFDDTWIRKPGSIDVIIGSFSKLSGYSTSNKNDVVQGVTWQLTGKRSSQYSFKGRGSG